MDPQAAVRYARALLAAAQSSNSVTEAADDLEAIKVILDNRPELRKLLESPKVSRDRKRELIDKLFADRARPVTLKLLRLLVEKRREAELPLVHREFVRLKEESENKLRVHITSAVELKREELDALITKLSAQTGKTILPEVRVDPSLIGGIAVRFGDSVIDGSISGALRRLRERLVIEVLKQA
ncbi:MAG: ATP synthase subunit delta [Fimbriimonadales bacterium]|nr:ATP synthase subunit delta [Fimbriimonadales bacterium]